jgi:hypothetical protein
MSPLVPDEIRDEERKPDQVVEDVDEKRAGGDLPPPDRECPPDRSKGLAQKSYDDQLRIAQQLAGHDPVAVGVNGYEHPDTAHEKRIVHGRDVQNLEWEVREEHDRGPPSEVIRGCQLEASSEELLGSCHYTRTNSRRGGLSV